MRTSASQGSTAAEALVVRVGLNLTRDHTVVDILEGGMGIVYKLDTREEVLGPLDSRFWAAKTLLPGAPVEVRELFVAECQTWLSLPRYDHIVYSNGYRIINDQPFIFMEWVAPGSLWDLHANLFSATSGFVQQLVDRFAAIERCRLYLILGTLLGIARGIRFFHDCSGRVHCDLKPQNVLIESEVSDQILVPEGKISETDGRINVEFAVPQGAGLFAEGMWLVKVSDFGLSCPVGGQSIGHTPAFAAPEQKNGDPVDFRTDVFGFGQIARFLFSPRELGRLPQLEPNWAGVSARVVELLTSCMSDVPEHRPAGFAEIETVLESAIAEEFSVELIDPRPAEHARTHLLRRLHNEPSLEVVESRIAFLADSPSTLLRLGGNLLMSGSVKLARSHFERSAQLLRRDLANRECEQLRLIACQYLALCALRDGDQNEARGYLSEMGLKRDAKLNVSLYRALGIAAAEQAKEPLLAILWFTEAAAVTPDSPTPHYDLALTNYRIGNNLQALRDVRRAIDRAGGLAGADAEQFLADYRALERSCLVETRLL